MRNLLITIVLLTAIICTGCELTKPPAAPPGGGGLQPPPNLVNCYDLPQSEVRGCVEAHSPMPTSGGPTHFKMRASNSISDTDLATFLSQSDADIAAWLTNSTIDPTDVYTLTPTQLGTIFAQIPKARIDSIMADIGPGAGTPWTYYWSLYAQMRINGFVPSTY